MTHIKDTVYKGTSFTENQLMVAQKIINALRPYVPRRWRNAQDDDYRPHTPHIVLRAPIVLISNAILRLLGQVEFTRRLSPVISSGKLHGLHLGARHIYEVLSGPMGGRYDINGDLGIITNVTDCVGSLMAKRAVFANFFDIDKIDAICKKHGFQFGTRMSFVDEFTLNMSGPQIGDTRYPIRSAFDDNRKASKGLSNGKTARWRIEFERSGLSKGDVEHQVEIAKASVEMKAKEREGPRKEIVSLRRDCNQLNSNIRALPRSYSNGGSEGDGHKNQLMLDLKVKQATLRKKEGRFRQLDDAWERSKKALYYWNRLLAMSKKKAPKDNPKKRAKASANKTLQISPRWDRPQAEDVPQRLDLDPLFEHHLKPCPISKRTQVVAILAEDPGVRVMSENVFLTVEGIRESVNRFQLLADLNEPEPEEAQAEPEDTVPVAWTMEQRVHTKKAVQGMKLPKAHRITARQVDDISFARKLRKKREQLLRSDKHRQAKADLQMLSDPDSSLATASTIDRVQQAMNVRGSIEGLSAHLQALNGDPELIKLRRTCRHRTVRSWAKVTSNLRSRSAEYTINRLAEDMRGEPCVDKSTGYCSNCERVEISKSRIPAPYSHPSYCVKTTPVVRHVIFMGAAGTGVGSRIGGHYRLGGKNIRKQHRQVGTVVVTDEYMSTQRCCFCFKKTHSARSRRLVTTDKGKTVNTVLVNGSKECDNTACPAFKNGYTTRPRDTQACVCIGISGFSAIQDQERIPLAPFRPHLEPCEHDQHQQDAGIQTRSSTRGGSRATPGKGLH
ncbi:hypothetical protein EMPS_07264 [Entomortierella parvispora]|uniref:Uncharacterized protein n=1 Tax=Entomortierella parvispora TaxID=205924 RepID=A0A9P3LY07_9FUNG|nr:hypothetical protein EMPS_07264 [Entomortierella parvispora]